MWFTSLLPANPNHANPREMRRGRDSTTDLVDAKTIDAQGENRTTAENLLEGEN